jgi:DNA damage-binding protein 1
MCQLVDDCTGALKLSTVGVGHHGHILSLFVSSRASKTLVQPSTAGESINADLNEGKKKPAESRPQLAIVGDLMRSISLVQHYPEHNTLEEVARDFNANWTTAVSMLTNDVYLGGENWNNLFVLRRNTKATSEEVRCRLDTVGEFHLGEMVNKFMSGSLVMPTNSHELSSKSAGNRNRRRSLTSPIKGDGGKRAASSPKGSTGNPNRSRRPVLTIGSQTLFGTTEGTLGAILGLDGPTTAFFACLERALQKVVKPIGNFSHQRFRAFNAEQRQHPSHGFVDGDLVESFLDLDKASMERVVKEMNRDGDWESDDSAYATGGTETDAMEVGSRPELLLDDVLALVEEMSMLH